MIQRSEMFQFPARARHEHQAEQSERDGIPGEATKRDNSSLLEKSTRLFSGKSLSICNISLCTSFRSKYI